MREERAEGLVPRLLTRLFARPAQITAVQTLTSGLRLISLSGPALCGAGWTIGDKIQVKLGSGMTTRTYTPVRWDDILGETRIIAHCVAEGPGSTWVRHAEPGQIVDIFGPRKSMNLADQNPQHGILVGDETAIGLAAAWRPSQCVFETKDDDSFRHAAAVLALKAQVIKADPVDGHLQNMAQALLNHVGPHSLIVLAGRARTIQHLVPVLRRHGIRQSRIKTKAYWAEGKTGLD